MKILMGLLVVVLVATSAAAYSLLPSIPFLGNLAHHEHEVAAEPDTKLNVTQIIQRWGYPVENYRVTTDDGYILQIQRIPHGVSETPSNGKVVFLQHGLFSSSFDFVNNLPAQSLGFILADLGYDVWLGNNRGNTYAREHVKWTTADKEFWQFTFDEFIDHDMPSMIDFVIAKTGQQQLHYVGHSQGTAVMFGLLANHPEYQTKISCFAALGPVNNVTTITSPVRYIAPFSRDLDWLLEWLGSGEFLSSNKFIKFLADTMCAFSVSRLLCEDAIFLVTGIDSKQLNETRIPVYISHTPAGTSVRNLVHFGQMVESARFQKYDFGAKENMNRYNQSTPPDYDVRGIKTPVGLYWSENDWLADPRDVDVIRKRIPNLVVDYKVPEEKFTHLDFLLGMHANTLVYNNVISFLKSY